MNELKTGESKLCASIFIFHGVTYYGCTKVADDNGKPWCSTKVDPITLEHVRFGNYWGYCPDDNSCLTAEQGQKEYEKFWEAESMFF